MTVSVDEAWEEGLPMLVDYSCSLRRFAQMKKANDLAVVANEQSREMLEMSARIDLDAVRIGDECVGGHGSGDQRSSKRKEQRSFHGRTA